MSFSPLIFYKDNSSVYVCDDYFTEDIGGISSEARALLLQIVSSNTRKNITLKKISSWDTEYDSKQAYNELNTKGYIIRGKLSSKIKIIKKQIDNSDNSNQPRILKSENINDELISQISSKLNMTKEEIEDSISELKSKGLII